MNQAKTISLAEVQELALQAQADPESAKIFEQKMGMLPQDFSQASVGLQKAHLLALSDPKVRPIDGLLVRVVEQGDAYGMNDAITHKEADALVEFYSLEHPEKFGERGQLICRYYAATILEANFSQGFALDLGFPKALVSAEGMGNVKQFVRQVVASEQDFSFDVKLQAAVTVRARSADAAVEQLHKTLDSANCNAGAWPNGDPVLFEASLAEGVEPELYAVNGIDVEAESISAGRKSAPEILAGRSLRMSLDGKVIQLTGKEAPREEQAGLLKSLNGALDEAVQDAMNAAALRIQNELGVKYGDFAGQYFSSDDLNSQLRSVFSGYLIAEVESGEISLLKEDELPSPGI